MELLITIALLAVLLSIAPIAVRRFESLKSADAPLTEARRRAIMTGTTIVAYADSLGQFAAYPDGAVVSDSVHVATPQ
jgi:hypothetical protein